jgi:methionine biosynthesis protein MetW
VAVSASSPGFDYGALAAGGLGPSHLQILAAVPRGARVLDVGCASGHLARALVTRRGCSVTGVEADPRAAEAVRSAGLVEAVREQDVEREPLDVRGFDCVVFGDVLEHLRDPAAVLAQARPAVRAVVSVPNIAHWTGRRALVRGRFPREDFGLFDRTHLRFFTRASARDLAAEAGFGIAEERFAEAPLPLQAHLPALGRLAPWAARRRPELFALQFVLTLLPA